MTYCSENQISYLDLIADVTGNDATDLATLAGLEASKADLLTKLSGVKDCAFPMVIAFDSMKKEPRDKYIKAIRECLDFINSEIDRIEGVAYIRIGSKVCNHGCY